jgi:hypothetical protein
LEPIFSILDNRGMRWYPPETSGVEAREETINWGGHVRGGATTYGSLSNSEDPLWKISKNEEP